MRIQTLNKSWYVGLVSTGVLALLTIAMLCPMTGGGVQAANCTESDTSGCVQNQATTKANVNVAPVIAVAIQDAIEMDVNPTKTGSLAKATASLAVSTNNTTGYSVYLATGNGKATLAGAKSDNTTTIAPVAGSVTESSFENNTWGYNFGDSASSTTTYQAVPTTQTTLTTTDAPADTHYNLNFATKVDTNLPADQYSNTVVVSAVANPEKVTGLLAITNMQDMTSTVCSESTLGDTKQLVDTRDGKKYWVAKLADGNCWMTQNLALDITEAGLKASDTDIVSDWNSSSTYPPTNTLNIGTAGSSEWTSASSWVNASNNRYYYAWNTATAGVGGTTTNNNITSSICPKAWMLPSNTKYSELLQNYGIDNSPTGTIENVTYNITEDPLNFENAGYVQANGALDRENGEGYYWTASAGNKNYADKLYFSDTEVKIDPYYGVGNYYTGTTNNGMLVRCVAR